MRRSAVGLGGLWMLAAGVLLSCTGCEVLLAPPAEAVLAGTWQLTTGSASLTETFLTFDALGRLTRVTYKVGSNVTINVNNVVATTHVDGSAVTIVSSFGFNSLIINGTLNDTATIIDGQQGTEIKLGGITISIDQGAITLVKQ